MCLRIERCFFLLVFCEFDCGSVRIYVYMGVFGRAMTADIATPIEWICLIDIVCSLKICYLFLKKKTEYFICLIINNIFLNNISLVSKLYL
jgi:hypothetical protein